MDLLEPFETLLNLLEPSLTAVVKVVKHLFDTLKSGIFTNISKSLAHKHGQTHLFGNHHRV